jgi:hypothetical protein
MKIAAAKAALLSCVLRTETSIELDSLRYDETKIAQLSGVNFKAPYNAIGRLKTVPEAMWLWAEAFKILGANK